MMEEAGGHDPKFMRNHQCTGLITSEWVMTPNLWEIIHLQGSWPPEWIMTPQFKGNMRLLEKKEFKLKLGIGGSWPPNGLPHVGHYPTWVITPK